MRATTIITKTTKKDVELTLASIANANTRMYKRNADIQMRNRNANEFLSQKENPSDLTLFLSGLCVPLALVAIYFVCCLF